MPLLTIQDLLNGNDDELEPYLELGRGISERYEQYLERDIGDAHKRHPGIHASEISKCQRAVVYSLMGVQRIENIAPVWKRRFKVGHQIHAMFQREFSKMAEKSSFTTTFVEEVPIYPCPEQPLAANWEIYSHTDGIFTVRERWDGPALVRVVLEIKTASETEYSKMTGPKPEHVEQAHIYMACLDIPLTWFLYFNKGNQNYTPSNSKPYLIKFDPKIWASLEQRFEKAHTHVHLKTLPPKEEGVGCEFCAFSHTCKPKYLERRAGFHTPHPRMVAT